MGIIALVFALLTVLMGTTALADLSGPKLPGGVRPLITVHVATALIGVLVLAVAAVASSAPVTWVSLAILAGAATVGVGVLRRSTRGGPDAARVSTQVLVLHGGAAALMGLFALLAAAHVG